MKKSTFNTASAIALAAAALAGPAVAQQATAVEEVIVTAQRSSQNLQQVPLAVTGYSGAFLEKSKIEDFNDLRTRTPSLTFEQFAPGQPRYTIRGIGGGGGVAVFVDDVYMGQPSMSSVEFVDLERVEVLRGPQGTLFGRNATGGAIAFFTEKPGSDYRVKAKATVGNYDLKSLSALISGPVSDVLSAKISVIAREHSGYAFNETTGRDIEDETLAAARAALRFRPNDDWDIQLNIDGSTRRGTAPWWDLMIEAPKSAGNSNPEPRRGRNHPDDGYADIDNAGVSLNANWDSPIGTFTSITAFRNTQSHNRANTTGLLVAPLSDVANRRVNFHTLFIQQADQKAEQFSQELRLAADLGDRFKWIGGLYYYQDDGVANRLTDYRFYSFGPTPVDGRYAYASTNETKAFAAFMSGTFALTEQLKLQAGIRWSHDEKDHTTVASGKNFSGFRDGGVSVPGYSAASSADWSAWTPTASINYQVTPDVFVYGTISRGFKSGGFSDGDSEKQSILRPFNPEFVWNYETGARTEWFDRRLRVNATAFYMDYTDLQVSVFTQLAPNLPAVLVSGNAGKAKIKGFELEWNAVPIEGLNLYGNYTRTESEISALISGANNLAGKKIPRAPENKFFMGASLARDFGGMTATGRVDYTYQSDYFSSINNVPSERVLAQENWDAGLTMGPAGGAWSVEVWGKNLANELHVVSISDILGDAFANYAPPRTYGVTLSYRH